MAHGSMRQRGKDSWELRVYQGIDRSGHQRWITKTVHGTQRFARRQLEDLLVEVGKGRIRAGTLADLLERWFDAASPSWAAPTLSHTRSIIDCHLKPDLGHLDVVTVTTEDIDDYYGHLLGRGGRDGGPLAPGTVTRIHGVLHRALAQAVRWEWMWSNPATNATPPRPGPAEIRPPSPSHVALLLESVSDLHPPLHCYLRLAASTGARRSQLLALRWCDVDEEHRALSFSWALVQGPDGPTLTWTKTHRTYRVELDRDTYAVLRDHRTSCEAFALEIFCCDLVTRLTARPQLEGTVRFLERRLGRVGSEHVSSRLVLRRAITRIKAALTWLEEAMNGIEISGENAGPRVGSSRPRRSRIEPIARPIVASGPPALEQALVVPRPDHGVSTIGASATAP